MGNTPTRREKTIQEKMYQTGLLKIAMKMKKSGEDVKGFEEIFSDTLNDLNLDPKEFRHYVNTHLETLMTAVKEKSY